MLVHQVEKGRTLLVDELAADDRALERDVDLTGVGAVPDLGRVVVEPHRVETAPQLVQAGVERRAGRYRLDESEALLANCLLDRPRQAPYVQAGPTGHIGGTTGGCQVREIERCFEVAEGHRRRFGSLGRRRGVLPSGHSIDEVVDQNDQQVEIASRRVNEVITPDAYEVAIARDHRYKQLGTSQFEPRGERNS